MKPEKKIKFVVLCLALILMVPACDIMLEDTGRKDVLQASGVVEAVEVVIAPEIGGRVAEVLVSEGDRVAVGDRLFYIEDKMLESQLNQAKTAVAVTQANYDLVAAGLSGEQKRASIATAELELASARYVLNELQETHELMAAEALQTMESLQDELEDLLNFDIPQALALKAVADAQKAVDTASRNLSTQQTTASQADIDAAKATLVLAEDLLKDAQEDYEDYENKPENNLQRANYLGRKAAAQKAYDEAVRRYNAVQGTGRLVDIAVAQADLASAQAQLAQAERDMERIQNGPTPGAIALLEAQIAVAQKDYATYKDGPDLDEIAVAQARVTHADAQLALAKAESPTEEELAVAQAQLGSALATLESIQVQITLLNVIAPINGVIMTRNVEPGEVIQPGLAAMTIGRLDHLTVTVYIPEDKYGHINLGDPATLRVDSFPDENFSAAVTRIADQAEYTPRNVQTKEDRQTTVYAVELSVDDPLGRLKPGMPTDVEFEP